MTSVKNLYFSLGFFKENSLVVISQRNKIIVTIVFHIIFLEKIFLNQSTIFLKDEKKV